MLGRVLPRSLVPILAATLLTPLGGAAAPREQPYDVVEAFAEVLERIETDYVDPVARETLIEKATGELAASLDPHSEFMSPAVYRRFLDDTDGRFAGVGVEVDFRDDRVTVVAPMPGSPAEQAGLRPGDRLLAVDGWSMTASKPDAIVDRMRGPAGTQLRLLVQRGAAPPFEVLLTRAIVQVPSVEGRRLDGDVLLLRLRLFQGTSHAELLATLDKFQKGPKLRGILLDLRSNPGGLVDQAVLIADEFLRQGTIFTARHRGRVVEEVKATPGDLLEALPTMVLVDAGTASAAEIVAGALQDHHRALLVGQPTFGKGTMQSILDLSGGAGLRLTTLRYFSPSGRAIQAHGLQPEHLVATANPFDLHEAQLDGHLAAEGAAPTPTPQAPAAPSAKEASAANQPCLTSTPTPPPKTADLPADPRQGSDAIMKRGYELLLAAAAGSSTAP